MEGWDGKQDGRKVQEGEVYLWLIHVDIWQKTTKFCKAIILKSEKKNSGKWSSDRYMYTAKQHPEAIV